MACIVYFHRLFRKLWCISKVLLRFELLHRSFVCFTICLGCLSINFLKCYLIQSLWVLITSHLLSIKWMSPHSLRLSWYSKLLRVIGDTFKAYTIWVDFLAASRSSVCWWAIQFTQFFLYNSLIVDTCIEYLFDTRGGILEITKTFYRCEWYIMPGFPLVSPLFSLKYLLSLTHLSIDWRY